MKKKLFVSGYPIVQPLTESAGTTPTFSDVPYVQPSAATEGIANDPKIAAERTNIVISCFIFEKSFLYLKTGCIHCKRF